ANADAVAALEEALRHVDRLPPGRQDRPLIEIVLRLAHSFYFLGRFRDTLDLLLRHQARLEALRNPTLAGLYYFWLSHTHSYLSEYERASELARQALDEATRCGDAATLGKAHYMVARIGFGAGHFRQGVEHGRRAIPLLERAEDWLWLGQAHWAVGCNHLLLGEFDAALDAYERARAIGEARGDPRLQTYAEWSSGWAHATRGDQDAGIEACRRSVERSRDFNSRLAAIGWLGYAYLENGEGAEAARLLEWAVEQLRQSGY